MDDLELGLRRGEETHVTVSWSPDDEKPATMLHLMMEWHERCSALLRAAQKFRPDAAVDVTCEDLGSMTRLHMKIGGDDEQA